MLTAVRNSMKGFVKWIFIVLLVAAFAVFGVPDVTNLGGNYAVKVGDEGFTARELTEEFNRAMVNRRFQTGGAYTREDAVREGLPAQIVESMTSRAAITQEADRLGLVMPRSLVSDFLQSNEQFQNPRTGEFDQETLAAILNNYNMNVTQFERLMREDLLRNQLIGAVVAPISAPDAMIEPLLLRQSERRRLTIVEVTEEMAGVAAEPTPDALKTFYDENIQRFTAPEYRTFDLVSIKAADVSEGLEAPEEDIRKLYDANRDTLYAKPETRTIYQITYDNEASAKAAAERLSQGAAIGVIADERGFTEDAVTYEDIERSDVLDPAVAEAAFAADLGEGDVAGPIASLFGFTVVQVASVTAPEIQAFEDVKDDIAAQFVAEDARRRLYDTVETIESERDVGVTLTDAAAKAGVAVKSFGPVDSFSFGPGEEIIPDLTGEVLVAAFQLQESEESEAFEYADGDGYYFIVVKEATAPAPIPYDQVADEVEANWRRDERNGRIASIVSQIRDAVAGGAALREAANPFGGEVQEIEAVRTQPPAPLTPILTEEAFAADLDAIVSGDSVNPGAVVIARVKEISFTADAARDAQEIALKQRLGVQLDQEILDAYAAVLTNDLGVKRNEAAIETVFSEGQ